MGVVRREGDWRLEKIEEGVYLITHQEQSEAKVVTPTYAANGFEDHRYDFSVQVVEVESFSEAESVFQEMASSRLSGFTDQLELGGLGRAENRGRSTAADSDDFDFPPVGVALLGFLIGGILISNYMTRPGSLQFLTGVGFVLIGVVVGGIAYRKYSNDGARAAFEFLLSTDDEVAGLTKSNSDSTPEKTPPAPVDLKDELYFERAEQHCEWCDTWVDSPDVHHIKPRSEGGPNEPSNLIVLCPNCHRKADRGAIPKSKLKRKVSMQMTNSK